MEVEVAAAPRHVKPSVALPDSTCVFIYSSGTTGSPKGAMHGQRSYVITAESFVVRLYLQPEDRILCVLPLFHINALFYSLRSEEHTSELQSLMRISYAVFCLKNKKNNHNKRHILHT